LSAECSEGRGKFANNLIGEVNSRTERTRAEEAASAVPNVKQVVNELEVKNPKATSSK
jgi:hypothetical protein